jgi:carbamoylphosphate synthase large subunit
LSNVNYKKFIKAVQDRERNDFVEYAIQYLPNELKALVTTNDDSQARHDVRFIYASLSRVSQTRDKQLTGESLKDKASEYLNGLSLSTSNKETLV